MASSFDSRERRWLAAASVGLVVFAAALASVLAGRGLVALDAILGPRLQALPVLPARAVDIIGGDYVVAPLVVLAAAYFLWRRRSWGAARVALLPAAGELAVSIVKPLVGRPRPPNPYATGFSFPSGHATDAAIMACLLAWLALRQPRGRA